MDNDSAVGSKTVGSGSGGIRRIISIIIVVAVVEIYIYI
jgi:hypothetical protein